MCILTHLYIGTLFYRMEIAHQILIICIKYHSKMTLIKSTKSCLLIWSPNFGPNFFFGIT